MATPAPQLHSARPQLKTTDILARFREVRRYSRELIKPLSAEDACVQSMPDASPAKWHLAHVTWFFETFVLEAHEAAFKPFHAAFRELFNSYYNGIGKQFSRPHRGMITRPALSEVLAYRDAVEQRVETLIEHADEAVLETIELGIHHEQQHQELLLMDIKHLLSLNPLSPAYAPLPTSAAVAPAPAAHWVDLEGGLIHIGHGGEDFHFDNEGPQHRVWLEPFRLGAHLVSNGDYREFIDDGGYRNPLLWLADGWATVQQHGWSAPAYWRQRDGAWFEFTLHGEHALDAAAPLCHLSYYEADAFAQWCGARLPSEAEWEHAAAQQGVDSGAETHLQPRAANPAAPFSGLYDSAWQWTRSAYLPYPGFRPAAGAVGEYNGKFMSNQMVLRGGACLTPHGHTRRTYRNFFYPHQRWACTGLRLASDD